MRFLLLFIALISFISCRGCLVKLDDRSIESPLFWPNHENDPNFFSDVEKKIKDLIEQKANLNRVHNIAGYTTTPLYLVSRRDKSHHLVKLLLEQGVDPNFHSPLEIALTWKAEQNAQLLMEYGADLDHYEETNGFSLLYSILITHNCINEGRTLVKNKVNINKKTGGMSGDFPLHYTIRQTKTDYSSVKYNEWSTLAKEMIALGADYYTKKNHEGKTALSMAKDYGFTELLAAMTVHPFSLKRLCINHIRDHKDAEKDSKKLFDDLSSLPQELRDEFFWTKQKKVVIKQ